jgi:uncharacterized protein with HEPN domain
MPSKNPLQRLSDIIDIDAIGAFTRELDFETFSVDRKMRNSVA